jgi:hypothetical protein
MVCLFFFVSGKLRDHDGRIAQRKKRSPAVRGFFHQLAE